jgi:outer membrane protein assembly factor BamB
VLFSTNEHALAYDPRSGERIWSCRLSHTQPVSSIVSDGRQAYVVGGAHGPQAAVAIRLGGQGDITDTHVAWSVDRGIPSCASPVVYDGLFYMVADNGVATCVDAQTGEIVWQKRLRGEYLTSPIAGDGKVYFGATDGRYTVIAAGREFKQLAMNSVGEECYAPAAIAGGCIFLRGREHLYCIGSSVHQEGEEEVAALRVGAP